MKKITAIYYTFDEFNDLLKRCFFPDELLAFELEIVDTYFWRIAYYPDDLPEDQAMYMSDFDALPKLSKVVGMHLENTHVSKDGIWLEGEQLLKNEKLNNRTSGAVYFHHKTLGKGSQPCTTTGIPTMVSSRFPCPFLRRSVTKSPRGWIA